MRVHRAGLAGEQPVVDHHAALGEARRETPGGIAGHGVDGERQVAVADGGLRALFEIRSVHEHDVRAARLERRHRVGASHHVHRADAERRGETDEMNADGGVRGILNDPVTRREIPVAGQHQKRGGRIDLQHGELQRIRVDADSDGLAGPDLLALHPVLPAQHQHAIAGSDMRHVVTDGDDPPERLRARHGRQRRTRGIATGDGEKIHGIDGKSLDLDEHFARRARLGLGSLDGVGDLVGGTEPVELDDLHGCAILPVQARRQYDTVNRH